MSESEERVATAIVAYLEHRSSLDDLQGLLLDATWDADAAPEIAYEAQLLIAEATNGDRSANDLAEALAAAVQRAHAHA